MAVVFLVDVGEVALVGEAGAGGDFLHAEASFVDITGREMPQNEIVPSMGVLRYALYQFGAEVVFPAYHGDCPHLPNVLYGMCHLIMILPYFLPYGKST